ncbi:MAG: tetratricopeptide repeat protein, partial [Chthoniobacterales bacterium]
MSSKNRLKCTPPPRLSNGKKPACVAGVAPRAPMPLARRIALQHYINAAQGYLELGMSDEALAELERVPEEDRTHEDVAQLRVYILMRARRWDEALAACEALRNGRPELP